MRKLATAALAFSAAVFLANYILPTGWLIVPAVLSAVLGAALAMFHRKWLRPAVIVLVFFSLGLLEYSVYNSLTIDRAQEYAGQTREMCGTVLDYPEEYSGYCRLHIRIRSDDLPHFKAVVYDNQKAFINVEPGQTIAFTGRITPADIERILSTYNIPDDQIVFRPLYDPAVSRILPENTLDHVRRFAYLSTRLKKYQFGDLLQAAASDKP